MNRKSPIIIGIAGGTGSGKSTFTNRLKDAFGDQVTVLYHDNYYRAHDDMPFEQRKKLNYDHPDAFETELLLEHLNKLKNWEAIDCPTYNYANHNRAEATIHIEPRPVILLEGILVLYDEALRNLLDIRIFVDADADERILRRILRDTKERGRDIENIIDQYLTTVKPMHALFVEPTRAYADVVTNSGRNEVATASFHVLSNTFIPASFFISCTLKVFLTLVIVGDFTHHTRISSIHIRNLSASGKKIISQNQTRKISSAYISWIYPYFPQTSITSCIFMVKSFILIFAINLLIFSINKATLFFRDCFHLSTIHFNFGFYHRIIKN